MEAVELACLKTCAKPVGKGLYRNTYRIKDIAIKLERTRSESPVEHACDIRNNYSSLAAKLDFLPKFYGVVVTAKREKGKWNLVVATFHQYIPPLQFISLRDIRGVMKIIERAANKGYVLDIKLSNFGKKSGQYYYLDECGIGRGPIPPDVAREFQQAAKKFFRLLWKIAPPPDRRSK